MLAQDPILAIVIFFLSRRAVPILKFRPLKLPFLLGNIEALHLGWRFKGHQEMEDHMAH